MQNCGNASCPSLAASYPFWLEYNRCQFALLILPSAASWLIKLHTWYTHFLFVILFCCRTLGTVQASNLTTLYASVQDTLYNTNISHIKNLCKFPLISVKFGWILSKRLCRSESILTQHISTGSDCWQDQIRTYLCLLNIPLAKDVPYANIEKPWWNSERWNSMKIHKHQKTHSFLTQSSTVLPIFRLKTGSLVPKTNTLREHEAANGLLSCTQLCGCSFEEGGLEVPHDSGFASRGQWAPAGILEAWHEPRHF